MEMITAVIASETNARAQNYSASGFFSPSIQNSCPKSLVIGNVVEISLVDGSVRLLDGATADVAAVEFWKAVEAAFPN